MSRLDTILVSVAAVGLIACAGDPPQPAVSPGRGQAEVPVETTRADPKTDKLSSVVHISDDIRRACGLSSNEAYFDYDSAHVRTDQLDVLRKLAACFSTGPLKGRTMALVGRADPRGDSDYNMLLGERRAASVANGLAAERLSRQQMQTTSRGEMDAVGGDETGWALDRRVDIQLAN